MGKLVLDLSSFEKAINQLKKSLSYYSSTEAKQDHELQKQFMAASIQAFEFTYELSVKFLRRYLEMSEASAEIVDEMPFPHLIRTGNERGLLQHDWTLWKQFRDKRNITSHTYHEQKAEEVMLSIPIFLEEVESLLITLRARIETL